MTIPIHQKLDLQSKWTEETDAMYCHKRSFTARVKFFGSAIFICLLAASIALCNNGEVQAASNDECRSIEVVFARGSGQPLNDSIERNRFETQIIERTSGAVSVGFYELGTTPQNGHQYPAVDVSDAWNGNAVGAWVSRGYANDYGNSVQEGVFELIQYLTDRRWDCKNSQFILAGYSQGAQVIGQYLRSTQPHHRTNIAYVALFGDPKLHLPEGEGIWPPACRGEQLSAYRRVIANCDVDNGSLGARKPYLPSDMHTKTGLWCYASDFICGSSKILRDNDGHGKYGLDGHAVDSAVIQALEKIAAKLPAHQAQYIDTKRGQGDGTTGLDVMFVIDTTGSMGARLEAAKQFAAESAQHVKALRGRVALVSYRDLHDTYTAQIESHFSSDMTEFTAKLQGLYPNGGGDAPEATLHALMVGMNGLQWQHGATKAAIVLTDAGFHHPDRVDGSTIAQVAQRSQEIDPVNIYPVVPSWVAHEYEELATMTNGQVVIDTGDSTAALFAALGKIEQRPTALLKNLAYSAEVGQQITFDASDSYVEDAEISRYEWDFNGDGVYEMHTTDAVARHTYDAAFDGTMQVRLVATNDTVASASAFVYIGPYQAPVQPAAPQHLKITADNDSSVEVTWQSDGTLVDAWVVASDGISIGKVYGSLRTITVSDLLRDTDVTIDIAGMTQDGLIGEFASVIVPSKAPSSDNAGDAGTQNAELPRRLVHNRGGFGIFDLSSTSFTSFAATTNTTETNTPLLQNTPRHDSTRPASDNSGNRGIPHSAIRLAIAAGIAVLAVAVWLVLRGGKR